MLGEVRPDPEDGENERSLGRPMFVALGSDPAAVLPMRLNRDAVDDLVLLQEGVPVPAVAARSPSAVITVDAATDSGPVPGDGFCQLSEAIANANVNGDTSGGDCTAGSGADVIVFSVTSVDILALLPAMTDPGDSIDGSTACGMPPCVELRGNGMSGPGLLITASGVTVRGLIVSDFNLALQEGAIFLDGGGDSIVEGNVLMQNEGAAIRIYNSASNTIGGTTLAARNLITENLAGMIIAAGSEGLGSANRVLGNYIGTDGVNPLGNSVYAINVADAALQEFGGTTTGAGNLISANTEPNSWGIRIGLLLHAYHPHWADGCIVQGNLIGLDASGSLPLSNYNGIYVWDIAFSMIGGPAVAARNVISGNEILGVLVRHNTLEVELTSDNVVQGNYIGTDVTGTVAVPNGYGIDLRGVDGLVGGTTAEEGNLISGNDQSGAAILGGTGHRIEGNLIGTDWTGTADLGNGLDGVRVGSVVGITIGGSAPGSGNVISGNDRYGVGLEASDEVLIAGNVIGMEADGVGPLGNTLHGILARSGASNNTIGGLGVTPGRCDGPCNRIGHSLGAGNDGVCLQIGAGSGNAILGNFIVSSADLGIDLEGAGVTPNDPGDGDTGANRVQNYPVLTLVEATPTGATIEGSLNSSANRLFRIEFFANQECDASGCGEGSRYLGSTDVSTDPEGNAIFSAGISAPISDGEAITGTATSGTNDTSEFSACTDAVCSSLASFDQTVVASDRASLSWATPVDVRFVKGDLADVSSYLVTDTGELPGAVSLDIASDNPAAGNGLYYLVKSLACGSWQTSLGEEPGRDAALP